MWGGGKESRHIEVHVPPMCLPVGARPCALLGVQEVGAWVKEKSSPRSGATVTMAGIDQGFGAVPTALSKPHGCLGPGGERP
jgi:hypothetical protein